MKKAFTMLELVAVIVVVAILSIALLPRFSDSNLREAADQILSHIRYTQHLAMIDERFNPSVKEWWKDRWLIGFRQCTGGNGWYYIVGRDLDHGGDIGNSEAAINPFDKKRLYTSNSCNVDENQSGEILITSKYGINDIKFSQGCGTNKYIAFDNYGRPYKSTLGLTSQYDMMTKTCEITFETDDGDFKIKIEKETGYTHLASINY